MLLNNKLNYYCYHLLFGMGGGGVRRRGESRWAKWRGEEGEGGVAE